MPRNGSGTYSLPIGNPVEPNTTIETEWANTTLEDVGNELTNSLSRTGEGGMLAPLRFDDGTDSVPGMAWLTETSSGFYREGTAEFWATVLAEPVLQFTDNGVLVPSGKTFTVQGTQINSGSLDVAGNFAVNTDKFTVAAASGNTVVAGTLGVTGAITATGGVNGNITTSSATITGGTINGTAIGGSMAAAGAFTTLSASGAFSLSGDQVQVSEGGTGATTAATARVNLLPSYAGNALKFLRLNSGGTDVEWATEPSLGTVTSVNASGGTTGMSFTGGPVTSSGTLTMSGTLAVANGGTGSTTASGARTALGVAIGTDVPSPTGTGASGTWSIGISGNAGTVTNGVYTSGSYSDPAWITSLAGSKITGNISGNAGGLSSTLAVGSGGTGQTTYTDGQLLIGNSTGNTLTKATLTAGSGITVTNGNGSITIASTAGGGSVTSVDVSGGTTGLTTSGGPVTSSGTITLGGTLAVANGGTNLTSYTANGIVYASSTSALATGSGLTYDGSNFTVTGDLLQTWASSHNRFVGTKFSTTYENGLHLIESTRETQIVAKAGDGTGIVTFYTGTTPTERMKIGSSGEVTATNTSANALAIGRQGTTNPVLNVDASTASVVTGLNLKGAAAAGGMALSVTSSGTNENLTIDAKGSGTVTINGTATGDITLSRATTMSAALTYGGVTLSNSVTGTGSMVLSAAPALTGAPTITNSSNAFNTVAFTNASTGTGAEAAYRLNNSTTGAWLSHTSTGYTANSVYRQAGTYLYGNGAGGLTLVTGAAQPIYFAINSAEKARLDTSGNLLVGTTSTSGSATNAAIVAGGIFKTVSGTTSIVQNTPTVIFAHQYASWLVSASSEATGYTVTAVVNCGSYAAGVNNLIQLPSGANQGTIAISGANVTLSFGGLATYNATWNAVRIS